MLAYVSVSVFTFLGALILVYTLTLYPYVLLPTLAALKAVDLSVEALAGWRMGSACADGIRLSVGPARAAVSVSVVRRRSGMIGSLIGAGRVGQATWPPARKEARSAP